MRSPMGHSKRANPWKRYWQLGAAVSSVSRASRLHEECNILALVHVGQPQSVTPGKVLCSQERLSFHLARAYIRRKGIMIQVHVATRGTREAKLD
jgi:hypothetical protein